MKISQFKRELERKGVKIENGTNHWLLNFNGKSTILKRHPSEEICNVYMKRILRQLGIT